jgi:hypothetical protein
MNPRTQLVMDRHRELKAQGMSGLEASRVVLQEAQAGTLGANKGSLQTPANTVLQTCACGKPTRPRGKDCWKCYRERSK